jgi:hypothetical protein
MDNAPKHNICTNALSSHIFRCYELVRWSDYIFKILIGIKTGFMVRTVSSRCSVRLKLEVILFCAESPSLYEISFMRTFVLKPIFSSWLVFRTWTHSSEFPSGTNTIIVPSISTKYHSIQEEQEILRRIIRLHCLWYFTDCVQNDKIRGE